MNEVSAVNLFFSFPHSNSKHSVTWQGSVIITGKLLTCTVTHFQTLSHLWCTRCRAAWWKGEHVHPMCVCIWKSGKRVPCRDQKLLHSKKHNKKWQPTISHCGTNCDWTDPRELWGVHLWLGERWFSSLHTILCWPCHCDWSWSSDCY